MVKETVTCEHCGQATQHPIVGVVDGRTLNFCCAGCLKVYEFLVQEGLLEQVKQETNAGD
jgi:hypothetical protein